MLREALVAIEAGAPARASAVLAKAAMLAPDHPDLLHLRGLAALASGDAVRACAWLRRAVAVAPMMAPVWNNLGVALRAAGVPEEAIDAHRRALRLKPDYGSAHANLAASLSDVGDYPGAAVACAAALRCGADDAHTHENLAKALFFAGRFGAAWAAYRGRGARPLPAPLQAWPAKLSGRTLLLRGEQGIGDQIFFLRFAPTAIARGARVQLATDARLAAMLARAGLAGNPAEAAPDTTEAVAVGDLPWLLGCGDDDTPPPLRIPPLRHCLIAVQARLAGLPRPWVGIAWHAGGVAGGKDTTKSVPPDRLGQALQGVAGSILSVQRHAAPGAHAACEAGLGRSVSDFGDCNADLETMLALMASLDGYVGVSSANLHLRCASGRASDVLVPYPPDWRWAGDPSGRAPWYPDCVAYRQDRGQDWQAPLRALSRTLAARWR